MHKNKYHNVTVFSVTSGNMAPIFHCGFFFVICMITLWTASPVNSLNQDDSTTRQDVTSEINDLKNLVAQLTKQMAQTKDNYDLLLGNFNTLSQQQSGKSIVAQNIRNKWM